jgi:anti-sigma-K factor RskA
MNADEDRDDRNGKDDRDVRAAEYVLGTLDPDERAEAQALIDSDPEFVALVHKWERRLGELNVLVAPVDPPAETWDRIKARVAGSVTPAVVMPPEPGPAIEAPAPKVEPVEVAAPKVEPVEVAVPKIEPVEVSQLLRPAEPVAAPAGADVIDLTRRLWRWRRIAGVTGAIAAVLAALVVAQDYRPDLLPAPIRPKPVIQVIEKPVEVPSPRPAQYVAVLQRDASSPAFLLTFDLDRHSLAVRRVGAEKQSGKSYELWLISDKLAGPRSLGLIGGDEFTVRPEPAAYDQVTINAATYAVSLEPEGGSPSGAPTGPVLYTGKLIQATPRGFDLQTP